MSVDIREWIRKQVAIDEAALRAEHYRARLGQGNPGMPAQLAQLERNRARLHTMSEPEMRVIALQYASRPGYDEAWQP